MAAPPVVVRHWPMASTFSSANPKGSVSAWQPEHAGLARCSWSRSRMVMGLSTRVLSLSDGTLGGGAGGGAPSRLESIHFPRIVGAVRLAYDVTVRILPFPSSPLRSQ